MTYRTRNILIAVGLALVAMLITFFYVTSYRRSVQHEQQTVQVYVAARNIAAGTSGADIIRSGALKADGVTRSTVVPGAIANPSELANLVLSQPIYAGEQVTLRRFADVKSEGLGGQLKGTMRAVEVPGNSTQVLQGTLKAGDHVDLVANVTSDTGNGGHFARIVLRNLEVLQTNGSSIASAPTASGGAQASVTLAVSDTQVQRLFYVIENANWTLELRPATGALDSPDRIESLPTILAESSR